MSNYKNLDFLNIIYKDPLKKISNIFYSNNQNSYPVILNTPTLILIKSLENNSIKLKVEKNDKSFIDFLLNMDELNKSNCLYNSEKWFSKTLPFDYIEKNYESLINDTILSFPLPMKDNKLVFKDVYDIDNNKINYFDIKEGTPIELKIKYVGLKFSKNKFYPIVKILNIKSMEKTNKADVSVEKADVSVEKADVSVEKADISLEKADVSVEKAEKQDIEMEKQDIEMEKPDINVNDEKRNGFQDIDNGNLKSDRLLSRDEGLNNVNTMNTVENKEDIDKNDFQEYIDEKTLSRKNRRKKVIKTKVSKNK